MATVPLFREIDHPSFEPWLMEGLDRLFAAAPELKCVSFGLWCTYYYDDNSNYTFNGEAGFIFRDDAKRLSEEDLDEISAVRMLERRASELWSILPLTVDDEGNINGEFDFHAEAGLIYFNHESPLGDGARFVIDIRHDGQSWISTETIAIPMPDGASLVDIAANDHESAFAQSFDPDEFRLKARPKTLSVRVEEDDNTLVFGLVPGGLAADSEPD